MVYWYYSIFGNISILVNVSRQQSIVLLFHISNIYLDIWTASTLTKCTVYMTCTDLIQVTSKLVFQILQTLWNQN